jgi:hypothetical protein
MAQPVEETKKQAEPAWFCDQRDRLGLKPGQAQVQTCETQWRGCTRKEPFSTCDACGRTQCSDCAEIVHCDHTDCTVELCNEVDCIAPEIDPENPCCGRHDLVCPECRVSYCPLHDDATCEHDDCDNHICHPRADGEPQCCSEHLNACRRCPALFCAEHDTGSVECEMCGYRLCPDCATAAVLNTCRWCRQLVAPCECTLGSAQANRTALHTGCLLEQRMQQ